MDRDPTEMALSTDVVMDIVMSHLKVRDLLNCRLISKFWNKAASSVLRRRSTTLKNISEEKHLMKLQKCMEQSSDFPFAGLKFNKPWLLNSGRATEFFQKHGDRFTHLRLNTCLTRRIHDLAPFIDHLPRLSILELGQHQNHSPIAELLDSTTRQEQDIVKLLSVRTIRISSSCRQMKEEILCEVLTAASPSLQIECLGATPQLLRALKRAGKFRAVSVMKGHPHIVMLGDADKNLEFKLEMDQYLSTESPSLTKLDFNFIADGCLSMNGLTNILVSSQHTLKELHLSGNRLSEFTWNKFPVFAKLSTLSWRVGDWYSIHGYLFEGSDGHNFPALKEFKLHITYRSKSDVGKGLPGRLFIVPSVTMIDLEGYFRKNAMKDLARNFPNVTALRLKYGYYSGDFMPCKKNPFEIWNAREFKKLEKLQIWNFIVRRPKENYVDIDSFLTGLFVKNCQNLSRCRRREILKSLFSEVAPDPSTLHLQLPNLKELVVCVKREKGLKLLPERATCTSMMSVWNALQMMPNLRAKFVYEHPAPSSRNEERDRAVLEAAFKHAQPYKLEYFSY